MTTNVQLIFMYVLFALVATIVNIVAQDISLGVFSPQYDVFFSMFMGTLAGLVTKYVLDKKFIFNFSVKDKKTDVSTFFLYSCMGAITTLIFWGAEYSFEIIFGTKTMRYVGAVLGLAIGYILKFFLDRKYVFVHR